MNTNSLIATARKKKRQVLLEHEGLALVASLGVKTPHHVLINDESEITKALLSGGFSGEKVVLKVVSPDILHKSDVGGIRIIERSIKSVKMAVLEMKERFQHQNVVGYLLMEFIPYSSQLGNELLFGMRWTDDFGPIVSLSLGGIYTELISENVKTGQATAIFSPDMTIKGLENKFFSPLIFGGFRGQKARIKKEKVENTIRTFLDFAVKELPHNITDLEINPLVVHNGELIALDVLCKLGENQPVKIAPRPLDKLNKLLKPTSVAVIGVSDKPNPGHIIVKNLLREGFPAEKIWVIKPNREFFAQCPCVPTLSDLPQRVDLLVLSISANQAPGALQEIIDHKLAESVILIPGGVGETEASKPILRKMESSLAESRKTSWRGPLINGGNCLGVRSKPGQYDTMFIPEYKLPPTSGSVSPLAFISQSGALAVARASKLASLNPRYILSIGNQMDLTTGDYLEALEKDEKIEVFACYVEGFKTGDGQKWLRAAKRIYESGRTVILYRAGRTPAGKKASASHTASVAGDYLVTKTLAEQAGVVVAESLSEFEDLVKTFTLLRNKIPTGTSLGAVSNAGFECVAFADNFHHLKIKNYSPHLIEKLDILLQKHRLAGFVEVHNPMDLTPMLRDKGYDEIVGAILDDDGIDAGIVGVVPLTPALQSLPKSENHHEDLSSEKGINNLFVKRFAKSTKPWVVVIDGGKDYDEMAYALIAHGIPTFRTADRAAAALDLFCKQKLH